MSLIKCTTLNVARLIFFSFNHHDKHRLRKINVWMSTGGVFWLRFLSFFCITAIQMLKSLPVKKKHKQEQHGNNRQKVLWKSGRIQFQHVCQLTQILYLYPSKVKAKKKEIQSAVFQLLFCLLPHFHFSSHSCPSAVPLSSPQLSLLFHHLCERYERKANVLAWHDASARCSGGVRRGTLICLCTAETRVAVPPHKSK